MDYKKLREEKLREAASIGDLGTVKELISSGVDVNSKNHMNGWTALHWAACRGYKELVNVLLKNGADPAAKTNKGETPCSLSSSKKIHSLLCGCKCSSEHKLELPITPNYLRNPPLNCSKFDYNKTNFGNEPGKECKKELVLRLEVNEDPSEFVEIEVPSDVTFEELKRICAAELDVLPDEIEKFKKQSNVLVRNDKDVSRLKDFEYIQCIWD